MRFRLRTLLIVLAVGPPLLGWWAWPKLKEQYEVWQWRPATQIPGSPTGQWTDGYLGALIDDYSYSDGTQGLTVIVVRRGTPAEAGGLMPGDIISAAGTFICRDISDFDFVLEQSTIGTKLPIVVNRGLLTLLTNWLNHANEQPGTLLPHGISPQEWAVRQFIKSWQKPVRSSIDAIDCSLENAVKALDSADLTTARRHLESARQTIGDSLRDELGLYDWNRESDD